MAICAMFASEAVIAKGALPVFLSVLWPALIFFPSTLLLSRTASKFMGFTRPDSVSLIFTTLARNSPLALAFAQRAFPGQKEVFLPLIIGPLIELPILSVIAQLILSFWSKGAEDPVKSPE
jgi:ACR3 family arsenite efflux pump ArsB